MMLGVLVALAVRTSVTLADDDGHAVAPKAFPVEYIKVGDDLKQLKAFQLTGPCRLVRLSIQFAGEHGAADVHLWRDIGSAVHDYIPFRHFEWDLVPPIHLTLDKDRLNKWIDLPMRPIVLENPQKVYVGMFAHAGGPRFGEDRVNDHPARSVLEIHNPKITGQQEVLLFQADGDYLVRLTIEPLPIPSEHLFSNATKAMNLPRMDAGAIAWGDVNGDGWDDLLVSGRRLFLNLNGKGFKEISDTCGLKGSGGDFGLFADVDNNGTLDLWIGKRSKADPDRLYLNDGHGHFSQSTRDAPADRLDSFAGSWLDYDGDGLVDLFVANGWDWQSGTPYEPDRLWKNLGNGRFRDVTIPMGIERADGKGARFSRAATAGDLNGDGFPELLVGTFRILPDRLWTFAGNRAVDFAPSLGIDGGPTVTGKPGFGHAIGANFLDFDNDGRLDIFVANLMHPDWRGYSASNESCLFRQASTQPMRFQRLAASKVGINYQETPTDPDFGDFDNDGRLDVFINSLYHTGKYFTGNGAAFADKTLKSGIQTKLASATASCDFDHDGRLDLAVADKKDGFKLYRNVGAKGHWLEVRLFGSRSNRAAIGATVKLRIGKQILTRIVTSGKGMGSSDSLTLHFGLGSNPVVSSIEITWSGGRRQTIKATKVDLILTIREQ